MQAKDQITIEFTQGKDPLQGGALDTTQSREERVSLDPMGEQSGKGQISYHTYLSLESGEGGPIYSSWGEGIQQETTQAGTHPAGPVVPLLAGGSTARAVVPLTHRR